jgi:hypothetical protein
MFSRWIVTDITSACETFIAARLAFLAGINSVSVDCTLFVSLLRFSILFAYNKSQNIAIINVDT